MNLNYRKKAEKKLETVLRVSDRQNVLAYRKFFSYLLKSPGLMVSFMRWKSPFLYWAALKVTPRSFPSRSWNKKNMPVMLVFCLAKLLRKLERFTSANIYSVA